MGVLDRWLMEKTLKSATKDYESDCPVDKEGRPYTAPSKVMKIFAGAILMSGILCLLVSVPYCLIREGDLPTAAFLGAVSIIISVAGVIMLGRKDTLDGNEVVCQRFFIVTKRVSLADLHEGARKNPVKAGPRGVSFSTERGTLNLVLNYMTGGKAFVRLVAQKASVELPASFETMTLR